MNEILNVDALKEIREVIKAQPSGDFPKNYSKDIQLTADVNPKSFPRVNQIMRASSSGTGTTTVYTTPTTKDFYLTGLFLSFSQNVTCDGVNVYMTIIPAGLGTTRIVDVNVQTLTAQSVQVSKDFTYPIKLARGSAINLIKAFTVGAQVSSAVVMGQENEI